MMKTMSILVILCGISFCSSSYSAPPRQRSAIRTIIIDPGHGGFDPGTHGLFSKEKDVALSISMKLGKAIQEEMPDVKIVYTRTTDIMPGYKTSVPEGIRYRAEFANKAKGDLFIAIHCNSNGKTAGKYEIRHVVGHKWVGKGRHRKKVPIYESHWAINTTVGGASYVWKWEKDDRKMDAAVEGMGAEEDSAFDVSSPEGKIRAALYEQKYFANSALFGQLVQDEFLRAGRQSEGVAQRQVGIGVLEATGMPSVLIETGYLTNKEEEIYLNSEDGQGEVVRNIVDALKKYRNNLEGKTSGATGRSAGHLSDQAAR
jgi:N-acetylmuramoyl-L-alanine amidase